MHCCRRNGRAGRLARSAPIFIAHCFPNPNNGLIAMEPARTARYRRQVTTSRAVSRPADQYVTKCVFNIEFLLYILIQTVDRNRDTGGAAMYTQALNTSDTEDR